MEIIDDNINAANKSFLYFLHEENKFDKKSFWDLCSYIETLDSVTVPELRKLYFIQNQLIRHMVYHFDDNDLSKISNLPFEYWEYIEPFERLVACLYEVDGEEE